MRTGVEWQVLDADSGQAVIVAEEGHRLMFVPSWCCKGTHLLSSEDVGNERLAIRVVHASTGHLIAGPISCQIYRCTQSPTDYLSPDGCAIALPGPMRTVDLCTLPSLEPRASLGRPRPQIPAPSEPAPLWVGWTAQDLVITVWGLGHNWTLLQLTVHASSNGALVHSIELALDGTEDPEADAVIQISSGQSFVSFTGLEPCGTTLLLDAAAGIVHRVAAGRMTPSWAPNGDLMFLPGHPGKIVVASSGLVAAEVPSTRHLSGHHLVLWSPGSDLCLLRGTMQLINPTSPTGQQVQCVLDTADQGDMTPISMSFSPCGGVLVSCLKGKAARPLWVKNLPENSCMKHWVLDPDSQGSSSGILRAPGTWDGHRLAWHPALRRCLYAKVQQGSVHLIDARRHRIVCTWTGPCLGQGFGAAEDLCWSPDGSCLYVTSRGAIARIDFL